MGPGGLDGGPGHPRVHIGLPDARDPLIGVDLHHHVVLGRARGPDVIVGIEQHMALDTDDPHGILTSRTSPRDLNWRDIRRPRRRWCRWPTETPGRPGTPPRPP